MKDIWTNITWANWLESHGVNQNLYALLEMNGNNLPKKVIATAKKSEDLYNKIPKNKRWRLAWWSKYGKDDNYPCIGSCYPSAEFMDSLKKK